MLAAAVGAQQGIGLTFPAKTLTIDGLDVVKQPGSTGNGYGVPIETVVLTEMGYGGVSSLTFTIDDPSGSVTLTDGAYVRFHDVTRDVPLFAGFLMSYSPSVLGTGRTIAVQCVGVEALLDWMVLPSAVTIATGSDYAAAVQGIVAQCIGVGFPIMAASGGGCTQSAPVSCNSLAVTTAQGAVTIPQGTLRQALQVFAAALLSALSGDPTPVTDWPASIDFYGGLRMAYLSNPVTSNGWRVFDYATLTVSAAASRNPSGTQDTVDAGGAVRGVYVVGGNAAGTGRVTDSTGKPGPWAIISEPNSTTVESMIAAARAYMGSNGVTLAGTVQLEENTNVGALGAEYRAGGRVTITDPSLGITARTSIIARIVKVFHSSGLETWSLSYGTHLSGSQFIRQLTRSVIN